MASQNVSFSENRLLVQRPPCSLMVSNRQGRYSLQLSWSLPGDKSVDRSQSQLSFLRAYSDGYSEYVIFGKSSPWPKTALHSYGVQYTRQGLTTIILEPFRGQVNGSYSISTFLPESLLIWLLRMCDFPKNVSLAKDRLALSWGPLH